MTEKQKVISLHRQGYGYRAIRGETHIDKDTAARYVAEYNTQRAEYLAANPDVDGDAEVPHFTEKPKYRLTKVRQPRVATEHILSETM